jgi:hypothetical protein
MSESVLLVDYENIGKLDLAAIPDGVRVPFFFGASQRSVPTDFLKAALKLGERFVPIDIEGQGKNALDFHIAFYLGEYLVRSPDTPCVILSKDKGFDPLVRHLLRRGFAVRRANTMAEALSGSAPAPAAARAEGGARPGTRRPRGRRGGAGRTNPPTHSATPDSGRPASAPALRSLEQDALRLLAGTQKMRRPRRRKGLLAVLYSHFSKKVPESELEELVNGLIAQGHLSDANGAITYHF